MGARAGKYKLGARAGKYKFGARAGSREPGPGAKKRAGGREIQILVKIHLVLYDENLTLRCSFWKSCIAFVRSDAYRGNFRHLMRAVPQAMPFLNFSFGIRIFFFKLQKLICLLFRVVLHSDCHIFTKIFLFIPHAWPTFIKHALGYTLSTKVSSFPVKLKQLVPQLL